MATPAAGQAAVDQLIRRNGSKRGLAVIVANDYSSTPKLKTLNGPEKDAARMTDAFNKLQIATLRRQNMKKGELMKLVTEVARLDCPPSYRSISFVFSGHGSEHGVIYMQDGCALHVQDMVNALLPRQAHNIGIIPKLFFIDACRGSQDMNTVAVPRAADRSPVLRNGPRRIAGRGATDVTLVVPDEGNVLVAYSTCNTYQAFETEDGGIWMKILAPKLVSSTEPITAVLEEVTEELMRRYQSSVWPHHQMQLPHIDSKLFGRVYLNPKSPQSSPAAFLPTDPMPPGGLIERGCYKVKFQNLEQRKVVQNVKYEETYTVDSGFFCHITFVECSNSRRHQVQGERMPNKADAKENAARRAVERLGTGGDGGNSPQLKKSCASVPLPTTSWGKDAISKLKEYCEQHKHREPKYECVASGNKDLPHQQRVIVSWGSFLGKPQSTVKDAKKSAAQKALNTL